MCVGKSKKNYKVSIPCQCFFDQKNEGFLSACFTTDLKIFVVLNPSEKQCNIENWLNNALIKIKMKINS